MEIRHYEGKVSLRNFYLNSFSGYLIFFEMEGAIIFLVSLAFISIISKFEGLNAFLSLILLAILTFSCIFSIMHSFRELCINNEKKEIIVQNQIGHLIWGQKSYHVGTIKDFDLWIRNTAHFRVIFQNKKRKEIFTLSSSGSKLEKMEKILDLLKEWLELAKNNELIDEKLIEENQNRRVVILEQIWEIYHPVEKNKNKLRILNAINIILWAGLPWILFGWIFQIF